MFKKQNDQSIQDILKGISQDDRLKSGLYENKIKTSWSVIAGEAIDNHTDSIDIKGRRVILEVTSSVLRQEMRYQKDNLINKINSYLGEDYINDIVIR